MPDEAEVFVVERPSTVVLDEAELFSVGDYQQLCLTKQNVSITAAKKEFAYESVIVFRSGTLKSKWPQKLSDEAPNIV